MQDFTDILFKNQDKPYAEFSKKLIPDGKLPFIGVRAPKIKVIAKELALNRKERCLEFFNQKHRYYEENLLHALLIPYFNQNLDLLVNNVEKFLPSIDNWAVCDCFSSALKVVKKHQELFLTLALQWLKSDKTYTIRFAICTFLHYFVTSEYITTTLDVIKGVKSDEYYVNMALSWLLCECLIKFYDQTLPILEQKILPKFVQNKGIQKATDSFRINQERKNYLKSLKI